jgi:hypothetical protein
MRFVTTGIAAAAFACLPILAAGTAHADQTIIVTPHLRFCALRSHVGLNVLARATPGTRVTVSDDVYDQLEAFHCLP